MVEPERLHVVAERHVAAAAVAAWAEVADFGRVDRLLPNVTSCRLEGSGVGARRHLVTADGGRVVSELVELDQQQMVLVYAIVDSGLPLSAYESRVQIHPTDAGCLIRWESWCVPHRGAEAEVRALLQDQLRAGVDRVAELAESAEPTGQAEQAEPG